MDLPSFAITDDAALETAVRDKTSYADSGDEWPTTQATGNIEDAKRHLYMKTGSERWYEDVAYGQALVAVTAMKAKEAVENINIDQYGIGDESISFSNADPDSSQQIQSWSAEADRALSESEIAFRKKTDLPLQNTSNYIG
jgi:hypothetical protein